MLPPDGVTAALMVVAPVVLFTAVGAWMMRATGRARFRQRRSEPASEPLNFRFRGYDVQAVAAYWQWLGADGRAAELRFLKADLVFPIWYAGLMLASIATGWLALDRPWPLGLLAAPVLVTVVADWVENLEHIAQLARFHRSEPLQAARVRLASVATSVKLLMFWLSTLLMVLLAAAVAMR